MNRIFTLLFVCIGLLGVMENTNAQVTISLPEITLSQSGESISAPVEVTNFNNVGAISLKIEYDENALTFNGISDPISGNFVYNESSGIITISWFSTDPLNIGDGTLFHIDFTHQSGNSLLTFLQSECEISDVNGYPIDVTYCDGWIKYLAEPVFAKIITKVWNDLNHDGIQDEGEPGLQWVTAELYDCNGNWVDWGLTNEDGKYLFDSLAAGDYYLKYYLIDDYSNFVFTLKDIGNNDNLDSDADPETGETICFTLNEGVSLYRWDAGAYDSSPVVQPEPFIVKDDYNIFMPDSSENVTYTLKFANNGEVPLLNSTIVDTLPAGTEYVSCSGPSCGETEPGSNVVVFDLGTLEPGFMDSVFVTASVTSYEPEYLNFARLHGKDSNGQNYCASDYDLNLCDTTSGGGGGGIESNGDLANLLLQRKLKIHYGMTTKMLSNNNPLFSPNNTLENLIPQFGPYGSNPVEVTPFDILGISNAVESYAVDYLLALDDGERRVGSIFSTITNAPEIYNHSKVVCDRLAGYEIKDIKILNINGHEFYATKLNHSDRSLTDYAISFSVYETGAGYYVENKWTIEDYEAPSGATMVYNFQVWTGTYEETVSLVKDVIEIFESQGNVNYMMDEQIQPVTYISGAKYNHNGTVSLKIKNNDNPKNINLDIYYRISQGDAELQQNKEINVTAGENEITIETGIISDASIYMSQSQGFMDEVFVSGGSYTYINGPLSNVSSFNTSGYPQQELSNFPDGSVVLSGGFEATGGLNDWITFVRSLKADLTPYNLTGYNGVTFKASGNGTVYVIIILSNTSGFNYHAYTISLSENEQTYTIDFSDFHELYGEEVTFNPANIRAIGFLYNSGENPDMNNFNISVKNIAFLQNVTGVQNDNEIPDKFELSQNYPNPFNPSTLIEFSVPVKEKIKLTVYDMLGQEVKTIINEEINPGIHKIKFNASGLSSGIYFYRLTGNSVNLTKKMILTK